MATTPQDTEPNSWHRFFAASANNQAWQLPDLPSEQVDRLSFASIDFSIMLAYAAAGAKAIRLLKAKGMLWLDRACGGALLALAGSLALYRKSA